MAYIFSSRKSKGLKVKCSKYFTVEVNRQKLLSLQSTIQITMAGNNKTINDNGKCECGDCGKAKFFEEQPVATKQGCVLLIYYLCYSVCSDDASISVFHVFLRTYVLCK